MGRCGVIRLEQGSSSRKLLGKSSQEIKVSFICLKVGMGERKRIQRSVRDKIDRT